MVGNVRVDKFVDVLWRDLLVEKFLEEFLVWAVRSEIEQVFFKLVLGAFFKQWRLRKDGSNFCR